MASGTVKCFNGPSGFGVITADTGGGELFVHRASEGAFVPARARSVLADDAAGDSPRETAVASRKEG